jgi:N-acetylmuramoyl-L-alanine amidase
MAKSQFRRLRLGFLTLAVFLPHAVRAQPIESVRDVRFTSEPGVTRVVIALSNEAVFRTERIENPDRVFFDLPRFVPRLSAGKQRSAQFNVGDRHVRQIRVAENQPGLTRLVFDMESPEVVYKATLALDPPRLIVEFRRPGGAPPRTIEKQTELVAETPSRPEPRPPGALPEVKQPVKPSVRRFDPASLPVRSSRRQPVILMSVPEPMLYPRIPSRAMIAPQSHLAYILPPERPAPAPTPAAPPASPATTPKVTTAVLKGTEKLKVTEDPLPRTLPAPVVAANLPRPRRTEPIPPSVIDRTPVPDRSMIRALGLKVGRIVIDPGHGGQDYGTSSPSGLLEKELVLDVSKRLAVLLRENLGAEVILTREEDAFVSLEHRTQIANEKKADLFISVHANSSPARSASGIETFYLNFAASPGAQELASRENASSQKNVHELNELLQKIVLNAKLDESREFATKVQNALAGGDGRLRNRGVKRAPFIVLIGADMPAILTEIGFVTNLSEESKLRRGEYRQKLAEQMFNGVASYAGSLNPMQVAQRRQVPAASTDSQ